jgi:hypothetical protein
MNAQHEADVRLRVMFAKIGAARPDVIPLSDYADENTFNFLLPKSGWSFAEWRAVNQEVARQLRERGFNVLLVRLDLNEFFDFLTRYGLNNTPENRAQFVAWRISPDNAKPQPLP